MKEEINKQEIAILVSKKIQEIGIRIKNRRKDLHLTQLDIAFYCCSDTSVISEIERGVSSGMTLCTLIKIAQVLEISEDKLFCEQT